MEFEIQQDSYGFSLVLETSYDMTTTSALRFFLKKALSGEVVQRALTSGAIVDAAQGVVAVPIEQGDLSEPGPNFVQLRDETAGRSIYSIVGVVNVKPNLG